MALDLQSLRIGTGRKSLSRLTAGYTALAPLYDALLGERFFPQVRRTFECLVRHHGVRFASAADIACGTGKFVRHLAKKGVPVVYGVDRSPDMLRAAVAKNWGTGARFLLQDLAALQLPQRVDLITCYFDSLNYLLTTRDLLRAFRRFHTNLNRDGHLIFDMVTDRPCCGQGRATPVERVNGTGITVVRSTRWDSRRCIQTATMSIARDGRSYREVHVQRGYPVAMVTAMLARAGFAPLGAHDFHTLGSATPWTIRAAYVARFQAGTQDRRSAWH